MIMIGFFQLVFNNNLSACSLFCCIQINAKITNMGFLFFQNKLNANGIT